MAGSAAALVKPAVAPDREPSIRPSATDVLDAIEMAFHSRKSEWIFLRELRAGTGRRNGAMQRVDAFALNTLPHLAMKRVCYEIKVSRADLLVELKQPLKRRLGMRYSNEFYFVTPARLMDLSELPIECGLIEAGRCTPEEWKSLFGRHAGFFSYDPGSGLYAIVVAYAPWRDTPGPSWQLLASMLRHQHRHLEAAPPPARPVQERIVFD